VPQGRVIVPLKVWQAQGEALKARAEIGVWLASDERPEELKGQLDSFRSSPWTSPSSPTAAAIPSPTTCAPAWAIPASCAPSATCCATSCSTCSAWASTPSPCADKNIHDAVKGLTDFSEKYQASWDEKNPLFRRVKRDTVQAAD
jgi:hypothetical protein